MRSLPRAGLMAFAGITLVCQTPQAYFELELPDLNKRVESGSVVVDMPSGHLSRLKIQLLGPADKNLGYSDVHVRINGKGVGNIFNSGANERGKFMTMDPSTLSARHDVIFDPAENAVEVYGTDRRSRTYYQNWILRSGSEKNNPFFTYESDISPKDESGLPPDLNLDEPAKPISFPSAATRLVAVHLKGTTGASSGVTALTANGKGLHVSGSSSMLTFDETVTLTGDQDALVIQAVDKKGNKRSITIPVSRPPAAPLKIRSGGEQFALLIGISRFSASASGLSPITAAAADASRLAEFLHTRGFHDQNIRLLTDEQATAEQVKTALEDFTARAKPEDLLIIFVSTHGVHDPVSPEHIYLAAADTQAKALRSTAIEISELQLLLNRALRCRHTLMFFDAEHQLGTEWSFAGQPVIHSHLLSLLSETAGSAVLVSAGAGQNAREEHQGTEQRGVFASALANGLAGSADINRDGVLTAREICVFVSDAVRRATGNLQAPKFRFSDTDADAPFLTLKN